MKKALFMTPTVTAFTAEGDLDKAANCAVFEHLIEGKMDALVVMGSTGEFFSLTAEQKRELSHLAVKEARGRAEVIIGTGSMRPQDTVLLSNDALAFGADAVMIISPYYFTLSDASLENFYDQTIPYIKGDVYLYNFPARTTHDLSPKIVLSLLRKYKNIVGYKDTVMETAHTRKIIQTVSEEFPDFKVLSGFDDHFFHNMASGGAGCIGGLSNIYPAFFSGWAAAVNEGNMEKAAYMQRKADKLCELYDVGTPFVPVVKKAMMMKGISIKEHSAAPLLPPNEEQEAWISRILSDFEKM